MTDTDTDLISPTLGETPFVLIEANEDVNSQTGFDLNVRAGGGINSHNALVAMLLLVVENLTGVDTRLYAQEVDLARRAAGLPGFDPKRRTP